MNKVLITKDLTEVPLEFSSFLSNSKVYNSSCSQLAKVYFIDKDDGYYLKCAPKNTLETEAILTRYFSGLSLSSNVVQYLSCDMDWLLTTSVRGVDCTEGIYLENPEKLCDVLAEELKLLHGRDYSDCPVQNRIDSYLKTARDNYEMSLFDKTYAPYGFNMSPAETWKYIVDNSHVLKSDTLIHGDYCLPNVILDNWRNCRFIDLGNAGVGDKHIDLYWCAWSLTYNLKTDRYVDRFFDAYGRDSIDKDVLRIISLIEMFG